MALGFELSSFILRPGPYPLSAQYQGQNSNFRITCVPCFSMFIVLLVYIFSPIIHSSKQMLTSWWKNTFWTWSHQFQLEPQRLNQLRMRRAVTALKCKELPCFHEGGLGIRCFDFYYLMNCYRETLFSFQLYSPILDRFYCESWTNQWKSKNRKWK